MNSVVLIGRLTRDPDVRYIPESQIAVATFTVAINRGKDRDGNDRGTDYIRVKVFGRQAENCERFLSKGRLVGVQGSIQTGSYTNKDGQTVYTTDVLGNWVEFIDRGNSRRNEQQGGYNQESHGESYSSRENYNSQSNRAQPAQEYRQESMQPPEGFRAINDDDIPF